MCLPGGNNIGGLSRDDGTVGVGDKSVVEVGVGHGSHRVDSASSSSMGSPGSNHVRGVGRDNSTVGMADQGSGSIDNRSMGNASNGVDGTASMVEGSLGSGDGRGVGGNHGAVGVTNQLGGGDRHAGRENLQTIEMILVTHFSGSRNSQSNNFSFREKPHQELHIVCCLRWCSNLTVQKNLNSKLKGIETFVKLVSVMPECMGDT